MFPPKNCQLIQGLTFMKGNELEHRSRARYGIVAQIFHWVTAILVLVAFIYGPGGSEQRVYSPARDFDRQLHETLGLCVFALVVMRILWRMIDTRPNPPEVPRWMDVAAKAVQWTLYLLLFALPFTAFAATSIQRGTSGGFGRVSIMRHRMRITTSANTHKTNVSWSCRSKSRAGE